MFNLNGRSSQRYRLFVAMIPVCCWADGSVEGRGMSSLSHRYQLRHRLLHIHICMYKSVVQIYFASGQKGKTYHVVSYSSFQTKSLSVHQDQLTNLSTIARLGSRIRNLPNEFLLFSVLIPKHGLSSGAYADVTSFAIGTQRNRGKCLLKKVVDIQ